MKKFRTFAFLTFLSIAAVACPLAEERNMFLYETKAASTLPFAVESELYDLEVVGDGLVYDEDSAKPNSVRFGDTETYLKINPKSGKKIANSEGFTVSFWQRNNTNTLYSGGTNEFERYLSFKDAVGNYCCYAPGGVSYNLSLSGGANTYKNTYNIYAMLNTTWKYITVTFDFVNNSMDAYYNGTLMNTRNKQSSVNAFWSDYISLIKRATLEEGGEVIFRGQFAASEKQTTTSMFDELEIVQGCLSPLEVENKFETKRDCDVDVKVVGKSASTYDVEVHGQVANVYDRDHAKAVWFSRYNQYISISPKDGNLVSNKGFTLSFWQKCLRKSTSSSDVNSAFQKNVNADFMDNAIANNDAWVNLVQFDGEDGTDAAICSSAAWSTKSDLSGTTYTDASNRKLLMSDEWEYVSLVVDFEGGSITYYVNGVEGATIPGGKALDETITKAKYHMTHGGALNFRKPLSIRDYRNHSGLEFASLLVHTEPLSAADCLAIYSEETSSNYLKLVYSETESEIIMEGTVVLAEHAPTGRTVKGWYEDEDFTIPFEEETVEVLGKLVLYADVEDLKYNVIYHLYGGQNSPLNPSTFTFVDDDIELQPATKDGFEFVAWYRDENFINRQTKILKGSEGDIELFARFRAIKYEITYILDGGVFVEQPKEFYTVEDESFALPDLWKGGYDFIGWFIGETKVELIDTSKKEDIVLTAKFEKTVDPDPGKKDKGLSPLATTFIISGSVVLVGLIGLGIFLIIKRRAK